MIFFFSFSECDGAVGNKAIVVFGVNPKIMHILVSLLSNDGNLEVKITDDDCPVIVNPKNPSWKPNPKYILCYANHLDRIEAFLDRIYGPFRFVVAFDYGSLFQRRFEIMLHYLGERVTRWPIDELKTIAMDIPYDDDDEFDYHVKYLQKYVTKVVGSAKFELGAMHKIVKSGPISENPDLLSELAAIQSIVDK